MILLQVLENVFSIFAIVMLIIGIFIVLSVIAVAILIVMSVVVNGIEEDKENNNWQEMTREVYKMRGKRTDTYYVYDAFTLIYSAWIHKITTQGIEFSIFNS